MPPTRAFLATFLGGLITFAATTAKAQAAGACRVKFLPGNSVGQVAGTIAVSHGRNDEEKMFFVERGGYGLFSDVEVLDGACTTLPQWTFEGPAK